VGAEQRGQGAQQRNYVGDKMSELWKEADLAHSALAEWSCGGQIPATELNELIARLGAALAQPEQEPQWDEVFDAAVRAYARSAPSREALRLCFQNKSGSDQISIGWTAQELMAFAKDIASLYTNPPQRKPLTEEEIEYLAPVSFTWRDMVTFARMIEHEHGIGGEA